MKKVYFKTFGCRTNLFDTQVMMSRLKDFEIVLDEESADIVVINSCTVTNGADSGVRNYVNKINRAGKKLYFTGCGVYHQGGELFSKRKVLGVFGHSHKESINELLKQENFFKEGNLEHLDTTIVEKFIGKSRAFIKIQEGCNFECSYCIIPSVRGSARSQDEQLIVEQISTLAQKGFSEFILTGTNSGSYGLDKNSSIAKLLKKLMLIDGIKRLRLGSLEPSQIDAELIELLGEEKISKQLHIAIQHSHDKMLEIMNRRNRVQTDISLFEKIASKNIAIGTDYIVAHAGETKEVFKSAIENLKNYPLTHIHTFIYSKRDNTKSALMKIETDGHEAKERLKIVEEIVKQKNIAFRNQQKEPLVVLVESKNDDGIYNGFDQFYNKMLIKSDKELKNSWQKIENYKVRDETNFTEI